MRRAKASPPCALRVLLLSFAVGSSIGGQFCTSSQGKCVGKLRVLQELSGASQNPVHSVGAGLWPAPAAVDWDQDGDIDLVVGNVDGNLKYFEQLNNSSFVERSGAGQNPFYNIDVGDDAKPAIVDWDQDGDLDLVVGNADGKLKYFEQLSNASFVERSGEGQNPFHNIYVGLAASPAAVDWDQDGDLDLVVGCFEGDLRYFEQLSNASFVERSGAGQNPFHNIDVGLFAALAIVDWDQDGDLDFTVGNEDGKLKYFERLEDASVVERSGAGQNPFQNIDVGYFAAPAMVDWDQDGDIDVIVGNSFGELKYFELFEDASVVERSGASQNPFHNIDVGDVAVPAVVDWDEDGDLDLIVGNVGGSLKYFEQLNSSSLVERSGAGQNPFHNIDAGSRAAPAAVDWDQDGDLDLVVGNADGDLKYFEQLSNASFLERSGAGQNPFHNICVGGYLNQAAAPAIVDWDQDGDLDLVVGSEDGKLKYFEQLSNASFVERSGAGQNPFHNIDVGGYAKPAMVDWDRDGDLDLVVGAEHGELRYFEQLSNASFVERRGAGQNPFHNIDVGFYAAPAAVDWDQDGDLDLAVGGFDGKIAFYSKGLCFPSNACSSQGSCDLLAGTCECKPGHTGGDCSLCKSGYYRQGRFCVACAGDGRCAYRGTCYDQAVARADPLLSNTLALLALGNGSCSCTEPFFGGIDLLGRTTCAEGTCPNGWEEILSGIHRCEPCTSGKYRSGCMQSCEACPVGRTAPESNMSQCQRCPAGEVSTRTGAAQCSQCRGGDAPAATQDACKPCDPGFYSLPGDDACTSCPQGKVALGRGATECEWDWNLLLLCLGCFAAQFFGLPLLLLKVRRLHKIADVSQLGDKVVLTTLRPHGIRVAGRRRSTLLQVSGTGHPGLDSTSTFRARVLDANRLQLLTLDGEQIGHDMLESMRLQGVATSMGEVRQPFPRDVLDTNKGAPKAIISTVLLLMPWCLVVAAHVQPEAQSHPELELRYRASLLAIVAASVLSAATAALIRMRAAAKRTPLEQRRTLFRQQLGEKNAQPVRCERGAARAVTFDHIAALLHFFQDLVHTRDAYYLDANIVKPLTRPEQISYAELAGPSTLAFFVSHYWGTPFAHFVEALRRHASSIGSPDWGATSYWVCFLSNNQWRVEEEVGNGDWRESSFYKALRSGSCRATCMVLDAQALPLTRSWCLFEVLQTYLLGSEAGEDGGFNGLLFCTGDGVIGEAQRGCYDVSVALADRLAALSVADASASNPEDQDMIMKLVEEEGGAVRMDNFIRENMQNSLKRVQDHFVRDMRLLRCRLGGSEEERRTGPDVLQEGSQDESVTGSEEWSV